MTDDLWAEASRDVEAERSALDMSRAKLACASLWPFLAMAATTGEFEHRLALSADTIAARVPTELLDPVCASLRDDFRRIAFDGDGDVNDETSVPGDGDGDGGMPWEKSAAYANGQEVDPSEYLDPPRRSTHDDSDEDEDPEERAYWRDLGERGPSHEGRLQFFHAGLGRWVALEAPESRQERSQLGAQVGEDNANLGRGNPAYFTGGPEAGPMTGETNDFPPFPGGPDGHESPLNVEYPMQPSAWTVTPGTEWVERPMRFDAGRRPFDRIGLSAATVDRTGRCANCGHPVEHVSSDGVSWWSHGGPYGAMADDDHTPYPEHVKRAYFDGGTEGVAGDEQTGFPADVSLPEPDYRVDEYGNAPEQSHGTTGDALDQSYHSVARKIANQWIKRQGDSWVIIQKGTGKVLSHHDSQEQAQAAFEAMEAHKHGAAHTQESPPPGPGCDPNEGTEFASPEEAERYAKLRALSSTGNVFFDPADPSIRMVAIGSDPYGADNPYAQDADNSTNPNDGDPPPPPPNSMMDDAVPTNSNTPQTTSPRQMPSGGMNDGMAAMGRRVHAESRELYSDSDPSGVGDPYRLTQYENAENAHPRQDAEQRRVNTPQAPPRPVPIHEPAQPRPEGDDEDDDDEGEED